MKKSGIIKFVKNEYIFSIITKFFNIVISMLQSVVVARFLGAELKGVSAYIQSITSIGAIIVTFGMHQAYPYFRKKYGKDEIYQDFVSIVWITYTIYFIIAILLTVLLPVSIELKSTFILIPLMGYTNVVSYITLIEHPNLRNKMWMIIYILDLIYVVILWLFVQRSIYWAISILLFAEILKCIVYTRMLKTRPHLSKKMTSLFSEIVRFGFFPMLALLMTTLNYRIDILMLHKYDFITDAMIGVYSLGLTLSDKIVLIPDTLKGVLVSKLAKGAEDEEVAKVARLAFWSSVLLCLLIIIFGRLFINLFYGSEYSDAYFVVIITATGVLAISYFKLIAQYNIVNRKQKLNVLMLSIAILVDVVLNMLFIPKWGINGAAFATSIGNIVCGVVFIIYFCKYTGIKYSSMILLKREDFRKLNDILRR